MKRLSALSAVIVVCAVFPLPRTANAASLIGGLGFSEVGTAYRSVELCFPVEPERIQIMGNTPNMNPVVAPYAWEKTEHGLAKTSRLYADMTRALLGLERHLTDLEEAGNLPGISYRAKSTSSNRPLRPLAAV